MCYIVERNEWIEKLIRFHLNRAFKHKHVFCFCCTIYFLENILFLMISGPASFVENDAGGPIIDASPDVCSYLTGKSA